MLGGITNVTFSNGTAVFTRLRVDRPSSNLRLHFRTFPGHFTALTAVQFTVVSPPTNTTRELVTFTLVPTVGERVPGDYNTLIESIRTAVSTRLGIDISRVTDIVLTLVSKNGSSLLSYFISHSMHSLTCTLVHVHTAI